MISLLLFIDFRKAFDTVGSDLLLTKLFHYTSSLCLITNYFKNRNQVTKIGEEISQSNDIKLGVPQGSILGPYPHENSPCPAIVFKLWQTKPFCQMLS